MGALAQFCGHHWGVSPDILNSKGFPVDMALVVYSQEGIDALPRF